LSIATALSRKGHKVLVVEKNNFTGGNCTSFEENGYRFDFALHQLNGIGNDGCLANLVLQEYGVYDQLKFQQVNPFMTIVYPDAEYNLSSNWDQLQDELCRYFPEDAREIRRFCKKILTDLNDIAVIQRIIYGKNPIIKSLIKDIPVIERIKAPFRIPFLFSNDHKTGEEYLKKYLSNPKVWSLITASWPYLGLPPSMVSGLMLGGFIATEHSEKTYYPIGSSQTITDALTESVKKHGGEIVLANSVKKIHVSGDVATGVQLEDGTSYSADVVVSNADLNLTWKMLETPPGKPKKKYPNIENLRPSIGPFRVYLGLDIDIHQHGMPNYEYLFYTTYDHNRAYEGMTDGYPQVFSAYSPSGIDPGAAPPGHSTLILLTMLKWEPTKRDWRTHKEQIASEMIDVIEKRIPGIRSHIKYMHILTPGMLNERSNTHKGAMYGWELSPDQSVLKRYPQVTPVKNLYLSGHWTQPGPGMTTAIVSGWMLYEMLRKKLPSRS
jgi:phytoene desaturase